MTVEELKVIISAEIGELKQAVKENVKVIIDTINKILVFIFSILSIYIKYIILQKYKQKKS